MIDFKNEIIWRLINEKNKREEELKSEFEKQAEVEIKEWSKLVDKITIELKKY